MATNVKANADEAQADAVATAADRVQTGLDVVAAAASAASAIAAPGVQATSTTSVLVGLGIKSITIQTGKAYSVGQSVVIADTSAPSTNWMFGQITSYDSGTGALVVYATQSAGSGTLTAWTISISASPAADSSVAMLRRAITGADTALPSDAGGLIDVTSGTFTLAFAAVGTLGNGWYCYIRNGGTGDVTLDPNASETIDGLTSFVMYPGEVRLVQCDGSAFYSLVVSAFQRTFTSTATFTKPPGYKVFCGLMWGGGASGDRTDNILLAARGGSGSGAFRFELSASVFAATETVTIGAGGAAVTGVANGNSGGTTSIGTLLTQAGATRTAGSTTGGIAPWGGGDSTATSNGGSAIYGAGAGGSTNDSNPGSAGTGGSSTVAGAGGAGGTNVNGTDGTAPGGGGGATKTGTTSGAGARGEVRIWGLI